MFAPDVHPAGMTYNYSFKTWRKAQCGAAIDTRNVVIRVLSVPEITNFYSYILLRVFRKKELPIPIAPQTEDSTELTTFKYFSTTEEYEKFLVTTQTSS